MTTPSSFQRHSTPQRDYLFPSVSTLIKDKAEGRKSVIRTETPTIIDNDPIAVFRRMLGND